MPRSEDFSQASERPSSLSDLDKEILAVAALPRNMDRHVDLIRDRFDMSTTQFALHLNRLLDNPDAMAHDPMTVKRWQRIRESRQAARSMQQRGGQTQ